MPSRRRRQCGLPRDNMSIRHRRSCPAKGRSRGPRQSSTRAWGWLAKRGQVGIEYASQARRDRPDPYGSFSTRAGRRRRNPRKQSAWSSRCAKPVARSGRQGRAHASRIPLEQQGYPVRVRHPPAIWWPPGLADVQPARHLLRCPKLRPCGTSCKWRNRVAAIKRLKGYGRNPEVIISGIPI